MVLNRTTHHKYCKERICLRLWSQSYDGGRCFLSKKTIQIIYNDETGGLQYTLTNISILKLERDDTFMTSSETNLEICHIFADSVIF